jgi:hypothetical protein
MRLAPRMTTGGGRGSCNTERYTYFTEEIIMTDQHYNPYAPVRAEHRHIMHGVDGRMYAAIAGQTPKTFKTQVWKATRYFDKNRTRHRITITLRWDDECKNGHNTFSAYADIIKFKAGKWLDDQFGQCVAEMREHFPELAHLLKWHMCSDDGPLHYIANTLYHVDGHGPTHAWIYYTGPSDPLGIGGDSERLLTYVNADKAREAEGKPGYRVEWDGKTAKVRNLDAARRAAVWPDATDEQLMSEPAVLKAMLEARLPDLLHRLRADIEAAGFLWEPDTRNV